MSSEKEDDRNINAFLRPGWNLESAASSAFSFNNAWANVDRSSLGLVLGEAALVFGATTDGSVPIGFAVEQRRDSNSDGACARRSSTVIKSVSARAASLATTLSSSLSFPGQSYLSSASD